MNMASRFLMTEMELGGRPLRPELWTCVVTGADLASNRNRLAERALEWGAHFILWADADHVFPDHALIRLFSLNLPVVGCSYPTRVPPLLPTALGLGLCLMRCDLLHKLSRPWFAFADGLSEDRRFFSLLREAGVPVHVRPSPLLGDRPCRSSDLHPTPTPPVRTEGPDTVFSRSDSRFDAR